MKVEMSSVDAEIEIFTSSDTLSLQDQFYKWKKLNPCFIVSISPVHCLNDKFTMSVVYSNS